MTAPSSAGRSANAVTVMRDRFSVLAVAAATVVAVLLTFSYLYGFLAPDGNVRDLPIGLVVEDNGATVGGRAISYGELVAALLTNAEQDTVDWVRLSDRAAALAALGDNELIAAVVIPAGYSTSVVTLADPRAPLARAAQIEAMPDLFRFLGEFMPLRYLTDGTRSIKWFDGRGGAGLTAGVWVLATYTFVCVALSGGLAATFDRRRGSVSRPAAPQNTSRSDARFLIGEGEV